MKYKISDNALLFIILVASLLLLAIFVIVLNKIDNNQKIDCMMRNTIDSDVVKVEKYCNE